MTITAQPGVPENSAPGTRPPVAPGASALRPLLMRLHFYAGVFVGPFLLVAALTGFVYAFAPTLEKLVYGNLLDAPAVEQSLPASAQVQSALDGRDPTAVESVQTADPGGTTRVVFAGPTVASEQTTVFVDPGSGDVLGSAATDSGDLPLRAWLSGFHKNLQLGETGNIYTELAASWLWVIVLAGVYLWWDKARKDEARGKKARMLTVDRTVTGRRRTLGLHGAVGAWAAIGLVLLAATGLSWSDHAGANIKALRTEMNWNAPKLTTALDPAAPAPVSGDDHDSHGAPAAGAAPTAEAVDLAAIDGVLHVARDQGLTGQLEVTVPSSVDTAWTVQETANTGGDKIAVDGYTMRVVDRVNFADVPLAAKLTTWGIGLHMGTLFGLPNQIALAALAAALVLVLVCGYVMWWQRRPRRATGLKFGTPPRRGALRALPRRGALRVLPVPVLVALAVVTIAVGVFLPVLGVSLIAFLLLDVALGFVAARRTPTSDSKEISS